MPRLRRWCGGTERTRAVWALHCPLSLRQLHPQRCLNWFSHLWFLYSKARRHGESLNQTLRSGESEGSYIWSKENLLGCWPHRYGVPGLNLAQRVKSMPACDSTPWNSSEITNMCANLTYLLYPSLSQLSSVKKNQHSWILWKHPVWLCTGSYIPLAFLWGMVIAHPNAHGLIILACGSYLHHSV